MYNDEHNLYHYTYRKDGSEAEAHPAPQPGPVGVVIEIVFVVIHNDCLLLCIPLIHCLEQRITWDRVKSMKFLIPIFELSRTALRKKPEAFQGLFLEPLTEV